MMFSDNVSYRILSIMLILSLQFTYAIAQDDGIKTDDIQTEHMQSWIDNIYQHGVSMTEDSVFLSIEAQRLIVDQPFRSIVYPQNYSWPVALDLIKKNEIKIAFWHLLNLYLINDENKNLVVKSILTYDKVLDMEKALVSTFYSYCYTDPEIGSIKNGRPEITAPHLLEKKLQAVRDIIYYIETYNLKKASESKVEK